MTTTAIERDLSRRGREGEARTNYETFAAADGALHITEFYDLPAPRVKYGSSTATVIRSKDAQSGASKIAVKFEHKDTDGYQHISILDEDEVSALAVALKHVMQNHSTIVQRAQTYTEVTYRSRGGFCAGMYVLPKGKPEVGEYMHVGGVSVFFHSLKDLVDLIDSALFRIETLRPSDG